MRTSRLRFTQICRPPKGLLSTVEAPLPVCPVNGRREEYVHGCLKNRTTFCDKGRTPEEQKKIHGGRNQLAGSSTKRYLNDRGGEKKRPHYCANLSNSREGLAPPLRGTARPRHTESQLGGRKSEAKCSGLRPYLPHQSTGDPAAL